MMDSLRQLLEKLQLNNTNGLFFFDQKENWKNIFPYWIKRGLENIQPDAFYYFQSPQVKNSPLLLFFENPNDEKEKNIHRRIWNFNQSPVIFIIKENQVHIYNGFVFDKKKSILNLIGKDNIIEKFSFWNLQSGIVWENYRHKFKKGSRVDDFLLRNIEASINLLHAKGLESDLANNLIGRLIFSRYLIDRGVKINPKYIAEDDQKNSFLELIKNKAKVYEFFHYLREKFNGDLFPLQEDEITKVNQKHLGVVYSLFNGEDLETGQLSLFDVYDFNIIPIELISNVYERFIGQELQKKTKAFYTPPFLVDYILSQYIDPFLKKSTKASCKVLDPACGSGIFLVEALRRLIEKEIEIEGKSKLADDKLKNLISENIFGLDKDENAINIAIFSLYLTLLDYKEPKEIENFKFPILKDTNFTKADFFDETHPFIKKLKKINFDFIIGNPPWGSIPKGLHIEYCQNQKVPISDNQIAQSFIARTKDFSQQDTKCAFMVTSKILYNMNQPAKDFRKYFLTGFFVNQILELSPVRRQIFSKTIGPAIITFYQYAHGKETSPNVMRHISLKPNRFFELFKTIVVEKYDYKKILQKNFVKYDWLWKVMLYGNVLDFYLINRLEADVKSGKNIRLGQAIAENNLNIGVGFTSRPNHDTTYYPKFKENKFKMIESKLINPYYTDIAGAKNTEREYFYGHRIGNEKLYFGPRLLLKRGRFPVASYVDGKAIFRHKIYSISGDETTKSFIKSIGAFIPSKFSTYILFMCSSQWGIERDEIYIDEYKNIPIPKDVMTNDVLPILFDEVYEAAKGKFTHTFLDNKNYDLEIQKWLYKINDEISKLYELSETEKDLIDYSLNVSIPLFKNSSAVFKKLEQSELQSYAKIFLDHFRTLFKNTDEHLQAEIHQTAYFVAMHFKLVSKRPEREISFLDNEDMGQILKTLGSLSVNQISNELYIQKDIKGFEGNSFYVIKPNEYKNWHRAIARLDLNEFMDAIMRAGRKDLCGVME